MEGSLGKFMLKFLNIYINLNNNVEQRSVNNLQTT